MNIRGLAMHRSVYVDGQFLSPQPSQAVWNHSPDGFCWGYGGSGPAQLALALLLLVTTEEEARAAHQSLKRDHVAGWGRRDVTSGGDAYQNFEADLDLVGWLNEWRERSRWQPAILDTEDDDADLQTGGD